MKTTNKVSAIVSAYYAKDFIRARLDNLMQQKPCPEIIVVAQSGSVEASIAKEYDITWILTPDIPTIYAAWNMAIKASNCDYITNANCDDITIQHAYTYMAYILDNHPDISLVYGDEYQDSRRESMQKIRPQGDFELLKKQCFVGPMPMWRKSLHDRFGYFSELYKVCGDYEFWLRIAAYGTKLVHLDGALGIYRNRPESAEHRQPAIAQSEKLFIQNLYKNMKIIT
jgi:GT2 family glycosyltransferase